MKVYTSFFMVLLVGHFLCNAQDAFFTKTGQLHFEASVPSFEEVKASSTAVTAILDTETGNIASLVLIKSFRFKNALMEEHFNENYMDSDIYPKATFKGTIKDFVLSELSNETKSFSLEGFLSIRAIEQKLSAQVQIKKANSSVFIEGELILNPEDYGIKIPKVIRNKIAREVVLAIDYELTPR